MRLNQACQRVFGNTDALKYEFIEENGPKSKQCILTITRPDGTKRSYATQSRFSKKAEAKAEASRIAIEMDALDFLVCGETRVQSQQRNSRNSTASTLSDRSPSGAGLSTTRQPEHVSSSVDVIEECCAQWRAGSVKPHWVAFTEPKLGRKYGCALRIQLSPHVDRVHMSQPLFDTYDEAKEACAAAAISEGTLNFIKHGNGQVRPQSCPTSPTDKREADPSKNNIHLTLQQFFSSLPRPFPEKFATDDAYEINAPRWLHSLIQSSRGGKLSMAFFFTSGTTPGLHGCLLRIDQLENYKAYMVDAQFSKRADAKAAVCLQAMSRGIGDYIRSIASSVETKLTPQMRSFSANYVYPTLQSELSKISPSLHPRFEFERERDAFGATLVVELSTAAALSQMRRYAVPCEYRSKPDAKAAVITLAAEQGVVEFVRFRGRPPPADYISPYSLKSYDPDKMAKRPQPDSREEEQAQPSKKAKMEKHLEGCGGPSFREDIGPSGCTSGQQSSTRNRQVDHQPHSLGDWQAFGGPVPGFGIGGGSGVDSGIRYPREFGGPSVPVAHGWHPSHHYGSPPVGLSISCNSHPCVDTNARGPVGFSGSKQYQSPMLCSTPQFTPGIPLPPARYILPGSSNAPMPLLVDTGRLPSARTGPREEELEPGEVVSPQSTKSSQSSLNLAHPKTRGYMFYLAPEAGLVERKKAVDPRKHQAYTEIARTARELDMTLPHENMSDARGMEASKPRTAAHPLVEGQMKSASTETSTSHVKALVALLVEFCARNGSGVPLIYEEQGRDSLYKVWIVIGRERFELPRAYPTAEEGRQRVAKQVLARLRLKEIK
ncbi:hypothetical protein ID866_4511 [Astraeus odoratus]|nr:hypothetical protein ID866_4511 [Astraeus odoratus]